MREIVHLQAGQCGNQIGAKVRGENAAGGGILRGEITWLSGQGAIGETKKGNGVNVSSRELNSNISVGIEAWWGGSIKGNAIEIRLRGRWS